MSLLNKKSQDIAKKQEIMAHWKEKNKSIETIPEKDQMAKLLSNCFKDI